MPRRPQPGPVAAAPVAAPALAVDSRPLTRAVRLRHAANWINLSTPLGLLVARAGGARMRRGPELSFLADRYRWSFPTGSAFTVGDVVISRYDLDRLAGARPTLIGHELVHSRQWALTGGLPFLPLYLASMGWSWLRTGDRASRCFFERHAGLAEGGYREVPLRPLRPVLGRAARVVVARLRPLLRSSGEGEARAA